MKERYNKFSMKHFKRFIVSLFLVFGYLILISYPYFFSKINRHDSLGPLSLVEEKSVNIQKTLNPERRTDQFDNHLFKGEKISGKIKATENNFGILLFRFAQLSGNVKDTVVFRIKEEGKEDWYYVNNYRANQFQPDQYFTFGFPPFKNSKNHTYVFEIESLSGTYKNGIGVSLREPQVALAYKYTRRDLANFNTLSSFIFKKFVYVARNVNFLQNWQLVAAFVLYILLFLVLKKKKVTTTDVIKFLPIFKKNRRKILKAIKSYYLSLEKKVVKFSKKVTRWFTSPKFYLQFLNTDTKKRWAIGLLVFLLAFTYRFSESLVHKDLSFYAGLGGQGDYDQFIRAATCAVRNFCSAILGQNFLIESSILGTFYEIFGFTGGLKAYLYLMLILSSIIATLPHFLLSRKTWISIGGVIGSLFLATSDFLTNMAINLPPDNGSLFTFSMFYIVYLLTLQFGTIRWLLFFGLMGTIDGLNKLLLLINDLPAFMLFVPVFLYEKANRINKFPFVKLNPKLILYSILPLLVFLVIYSIWEYIVQVKFSTPYYFRALLEGGSTYASSTDAGSVSINDGFAKGNILEEIYYYAGLSIVMVKRLLENASLNTFLLTPIFIGLLFFTFRKQKFFITKLLSVVIFLVVVCIILALFKSNYLGIQDVGVYVYAWPESNYTNIFLFMCILFLFILNLRYSALRLLIPILPYWIMLIILTKNAPWDRLWVHVIVWSVMLLSFLVDWLLHNAKKDYILKRVWLGPLLLALFIFLYTIPKQVSMIGNLYANIKNYRNEVTYLRWVNKALPKNAIVLAGGKSDLITVAQNVNRPIIYNTLWTAALLIKPNEIPLVKPTDFAILDQLKVTKMPGVTPSDFSIVEELKNKDNFKKKKYVILENDIYLWRGRLAGVDDSVFATASATLLHADDYAINVYKFNSDLNECIYELKIKER